MFQAVLNNCKYLHRDDLHQLALFYSKIRGVISVQIHVLPLFLLRGSASVNSCLPWTTKLFRSEIKSSRKKFAPLGANSFLKELILLRLEGVQYENDSCFRDESGCYYSPLSAWPRIYGLASIFQRKQL